MKKYQIQHFLLMKGCRFKQSFRVMRISTLLIMFCVLCSYAGNINSQNAKVSLNMNNVLLEKVLNEIELQTEYLFIYNQQVNINKTVSLNVDKQTVSKVLDKIFADTDIHYRLKGKHIILSPATNAVNKAQQQNLTIKGFVKDTKGLPVIGATVIEKGTTNGTATDINGNFTLTVSSAKSLLEVSYIGYKKEEVEAMSGKPVSIVLHEDNELLDEIVVVGYGSQVKVNLTGSVASIDSKELADRPVTSVSSGLQGLVPGMTVTSGEGRPGQDGASILIRGLGTWNSASPYILIDGIQSGSMNQIDPNDIASISVLKDAASAAIYGSKAANGVILITTKRGKTGRATVNYSGKIGWQKATGFVERMHSGDAAEYYNKALENSGAAPRFTEEEIKKFKDGSDPFAYPDTDWNKLGFDGSGFMNQHNVSVSGGNEHVKYMTSAGFLDQNGIMRNCNRRQFNMRSNIDIVLSDKFTLRSGMSYINNYYKDADNSYIGGGSDQIIRQINRIAPWIPYKNEDGTYGTIGDGNPIAWLDLNQTINRKNQNFAGNIELEYNITDGLQLSAKGAYTGNNQEYDAFRKDIQYNKNKYHGPNKLSSRAYFWDRESIDLLLNYQKTLGRHHHLKALAGYRMEDYHYKELRGERENFPNNTLTDLNAGTESTQTNSGYTRELSMMSYFGRINYDYKGRYLFEANLRADASSRFSPDHRWGYFPSVSVGWRISEETFMNWSKKWMDSMKIRASWGQLGNQSALNSDNSNDYYPWMVTYSIGHNYPFDDTVETGIAQTSHRISSISWEKSTTWGVGIDMVLLNAVDLSIDFYNRKTTDIIMSVPVPGTFGLKAYKDNVGAMSNRGLEISVGYHKEWKDWKFRVNGNWSTNHNKVLDLGGVDKMYDGNKIHQVGKPYASFYTYQADGLFKSQEEADEYTKTYGNPFGPKFMAGDIRYKDTSGDGKLTSADRVIGNSEKPKFTFGLNLSAAWKSLDLSLLMQGASGVQRYFTEEVFGTFEGDTSHPSTAWFDAWSPENPNGSFPRLYSDKTSSSRPSNYSTFWLFSTNYLRIKNIQLGWTLPKAYTAHLGISKARIFYSGENLLKFDNLPVNIDPEAPSGRGSHYPQVMTNSFGINITF